MTTIDIENEASLQAWSKRHFDLTYCEFSALRAIVVAFRIGEERVLQSEVRKLLITFEGRDAGHAFLLLERKGLIVAGPSRREKFWSPTPRGITRILGPLVADLRSGPGLIDAPSEIVDEEREAVVA